MIAPVLVPVAFASNEPEAEMIALRLHEAGIDSVTKFPDLPGIGVQGGKDIYVEEEFAEQAKELLAAPDISEEELAELSEQAGPPPDV
jgi:hypothetical protein